MTYVFDTGSLIILFRNYYKSRFPSLWEAFDDLVLNGSIISVKEVLREVEPRDDALAHWSKSNSKIFLPPAASEAAFIAEMFRAQQFQFLVQKQKMLEGGPLADPFVIAKAKQLNATVVTQEGYRADGTIKPNAAKIPNVCQYFKINCLNLERFMEQENWSF